MYFKYLRLISICILCFSYSPLQAQGADPLNKTPTLLESSEIILVWSEKIPNENDYVFGQKIYDYGDTNQLKVGIRGDEVDAIHNSQVAVITGNFNNDDKIDVVSAYINTSNKVRLVLPNNITPPNFSWSQVSSVLSAGNINTTNEYYKRMKLKTGNFDDDEEEEIVLVYINTDNKIQIEIYDTDGTLNPSFRGSINDESAETQLIGFDVVVSDFNEDGKDEIVIAGIDPSGGGGSLWGIFAKVYEVTGSNPFTLTPKGKQIIFTQPQYNVSYVNVNLAAGDFNDDVIPDLAFSFSMFTQELGIDDSFLYLMEISSNLNNISFNETRKASRNSVGDNEMSKNDLEAGDLNADGLDEIIWGIGGNVYIYQPDTSMIPVYKTQIGISEGGNSDNQLTNNYLSVLDVDRDLKDDIVTVVSYYSGEPNSDQWFEIKVYGITGEDVTAIFLKAQKNNEENIQINGGNSEYRNYAIALGDFDGDRVRLGTPTRYQITDILQPMVILNAPPIHFDIINGTAYDLNKCYNSNNCQFHSIYQKVTTNSVEVSSTINREWGVDASLSGGGNFLGIGVKASMKASYGEKFSKVANSTKKVTVGVSVIASDDDYIYATVVDYDVWEYPVYTDSGFQGNILVLYPLLTENRWFPSKSWSGSSYKPNHEVGNILSYYSYTDSLEQNEEVAQKIKGSLNESFVLNGNSNIDWYQTFEEFQSNQASSTWTVGMEVGASVSGWGLEVGVNGHYSQSEISTHTTSVSDSISLKVHLDKIDMSIGEVSYLVTPYSYWAKNGALVIDYAVRPELSQPGGTPTWWQVNYGSKPDPAFILPWKYDPEKGNTLEDPNKRFQTKEITFHPSNVVPGDTVTVRARIHNYSLVPTPDIVKVKFYVGDPDSGGTLISSLSGETEFSTPEIISARGKQTVQFQWAIPASLPLFSRIYAVIDPDNQIDELQSNNNKGWTVLGRTVPTSVDDEIKYIVTGYELSQNYPNPFNPVTKITYSIQRESKVSLKVYDILGREVATLVDEIKQMGRYEVEFGNNTLASGVYFYRLQAGDFVSTKKMMLLR